MGCTLTRPTGDTLRCQGKLRPGAYSIDGGVSSQYITGLLFALPLIGNSTLEVTGKIESKPYIHLTKQVLELFHSPDFHSPGNIRVEGDWSNGAFWMTANALDSELSIYGLNPDSVQGDRAVTEILPRMLSGCPTVSAADIPDLVPILSVMAAANHGAVFTDIQRLRIKESDRVATTIEMIKNLGGNAEATEETLTIYGTGLIGGTVSSHNDHRIAMAAAIASTVCTQKVTVLNAEAVNKSYPHFWAEFTRLGGKI